MGIIELQKRAAPLRAGKLWNAVVAFAALIDFPLDDFQICLIVVSIKRRTTWHISAMRKIGKTHVLGFMLLFLGTAGFRGIYANHKAEYSKEVFEFVKPYAMTLKELGYVSRIEPSHGFLNIYYTSGGVNMFRTRSEGIGRGIMKLDFIFWDEAQKMKAASRKEASGAMYPSKLKLEVFIGNPATKKDLDLYPDSPFTQAKIAGRKNFIEFSGAKAYSPDLVLDAKLLVECNPNWHRLGDLEQLLKEEFEEKSHETIAAELFGIWDIPEDIEKIEPELSAPKVKSILTNKLSTATKFYLSVAIDYKSKEAFMVITDGVVMEVAEVIELPLGSVEPVAKWILANKPRFRKIMVMGTAKGKVLVDLLASIKRLVEVIQPGSFAVSMSRFMQQAENGSLKVVETVDTRGALSSFYIAYDQKTAAPVAKAGTPEDISLIMSLMMAAVDETALKRISKVHRPQENIEPKVAVEKSVSKIPEKPKEPARDSMAEYLERMNK